MHQSAIMRIPACIRWSNGRWTVRIGQDLEKQMNRTFKTVGAVVLIGLAYLLLWPVPIEPFAWQAPDDRGYVDAFEKNNRLSALKFIDLAGDSGPEDAAIGPDGAIYVPTHSGKILKVDPLSLALSEFSRPGGRVLGLEFSASGELYAADAHRGLLKIGGDGAVTVLTDKTSDGSPIKYADDLDIASDGTVYFSDASTKFGAEEFGGTLSSSLLDLMEHGPHGRVLKYDPVSRDTTVVLDGLSFANGIALAADESFLLIAETGTYSVLKLWLSGDKSGQAETLIENLPGFPDNINDNSDGTFWMGLVSPRSAAADAMSNTPFLRKIVMRLPAAVRPKPQRYGFAVRFDAEGTILDNLQDPSGDYALVTGAVDAADGKVVVTSLTEPRLGYLEKP